MLFSVLIPVYNTSKYIDECIQSVLSQTEKDYEIVLIDDGSTDNSGKICDKYAEKYPFIRVIHKANEGLLMTRRRGFQEAKGDYFICLDSDDYFCDNEAFSKIKSMIVKNNCDLVVYNYLMETDSKENNREINLFEKPNEYVFNNNEKHVLYNKLLLDKYFNTIWIKVAKRQNVDIDVDYSKWDKSIYKSQGEDLFQSMPILDKAQKVGYIKGCLYFYRWNEASISKNPSIEFYYSYKTIYLRENEYFVKWNFDDERIQKKLLGRIKMIMSVIISAHNRDKKEWNKFVSTLCKDEFFLTLFNVKDKRKVLLYYRMVGFFLRNRMIHTASLLITVVSFLSAQKHKGK